MTDRKTFAQYTDEVAVHLKEKHGVVLREVKGFEWEAHLMYCYKGFWDTVSAAQILANDITR